MDAIVNTATGMVDNAASHVAYSIQQHGPGVFRVFVDADDEAGAELYAPGYVLAPSTPEDFDPEFSYFEGSVWGKHGLTAPEAAALKSACDAALASGEAESASDLLSVLSAASALPAGTKLEHLFSRAVSMGIDPSSVSFVWDYPSWVDRLANALGSGSYADSAAMLLTMPKNDDLDATGRATVLAALQDMTLRLVDLYDKENVGIPNPLTQAHIDEALNRVLP